jgi:hypothetical protein
MCAIENLTMGRLSVHMLSVNLERIFLDALLIKISYRGSKAECLTMNREMIDITFQNFLTWLSG